MSVKVMGIVWEADLPRNQKMVLLSYADHADHNGSNVYPSVGLMAWKTGYSERAIQSITRELEEANILIPTGTGPRGTNRYRINFEALPARPPYGGGEISAPPAESAPGGVKKSAEGGEISAPEPSVNRQLEPSYNNNARELVQRFEQKTGYAPPHETTDAFKEKWIDPFERVLSKAGDDVDVAWLHINNALDALWSKGYHISDPTSVYKSALMELHHDSAEKKPTVDRNGIFESLVQPYARSRLKWADLDEAQQKLLRQIDDRPERLKDLNDKTLRIRFYQAVPA